MKSFLPSVHGGRYRTGGGRAAIASALALGLLATSLSAQELNVPAPARPRTAASAAAPVAAPVRKRPLAVGILSSGMHFLCRSNTSSELVSVVCLVKAGLADEREEQAGIAALTAEALLKGTTTHPGRRFLNEVNAAGGNISTTPGFDFTEISVTASKGQIEGIIKLIGDVVSHPQFAPEDVTAARETLKRRTAAFADDFTGASYQTLAGELYPNSPYGRPINGYAETLDKLTAADVRAFWQANYVQSRMVVSVVGDIDANQALTMAQKAFSAVPGKAAAPTPRPNLSSLRTPPVRLIQRDGPAAQIMAGFLAPAASRDNYPVYALVDAIVGGGKRGRLFTNIREKHSLGYEMGSFYQPLLHQSHMVGYVITPQYRRNPKTEQPESLVNPVKGYLMEQYESLAETGPTDQELARARNYVIGRYALRQERTREQAKWLAWNDLMGLGRDFDEYFVSRVPTITKEQIQAAAKGMVRSYGLVVTVPEK